jgi:long-chain acyl-CoA synthetase
MSVASPPRQADPAPIPARPRQPGESTLGEFLTEVAARYGESPALLIKPGFRTRVTSYAGLERAALRVARYLQSRGIRQGDRVVLWAPNMPEWVQLYFGCHKAGAVIVPLDVRSAPDFVDAVIQRTDPRLVVLSRITARSEHEISAPTIQLELLDRELPAETELLEPVAVEPHDLAEIMFTSGTTGDPKGVMLTHHNIISDMLGAERCLKADPSFRLLSLLPLSHMLEQTVGLLMPLHGGARIVYPVSRQPSVLFRTIGEYHVTMMIVVPQALQLFLNSIEREARRQGREHLLERLFAIAPKLPVPGRRLLFRSIHQKLGGSLRHLICGGAYLDPALALRWELMGVTVLQGYGATEASPIITGDRHDLRKLGAVGTPIPGVQVRIAEDGEILAHGDIIFPGYWQNPEATAAALEDGWYHTGDLGFLDDQGFLHLKGRKKDLIVLANGQNVFPEDIEAELNQHPAVKEAVVLGLQRDRGAVEVHAVLLMNDPAQAAQAVEFANARLADHQRVQAHTVWPLDDFPRTHTLKVKKREVEAFLGSQGSGEASPQSEVPAPVAASTLYRIVAELGSVPVTRITSSRTLGGDLSLDSLGRVELLSAIEGELGAYVDESAISPNTTVGELERLVEQAQQRSNKSDFLEWPLGTLGHLGREAFLQGIAFPAYHLAWQIKVVGQEHLEGLESPVIFASNHNFGVGEFGLDPAAAWMAIPRRLRVKTCTAGEEHAVFDQPIKGFFARLVNAFPLSKEGNVRGSLEYMGRLLDLGWSVLIFPEGKLTVDGPMQPFMGGTGLIAVEAQTPVIPMNIHVEKKGFVDGGTGRGAFTVVLGKPLIFPPGTPYAQATADIEEAVRAL